MTETWASVAAAREEVLEVIREKMEQRGIMNMTSVMDAADLGDEKGKYTSADTAAENFKMAVKGRLQTRSMQTEL